MKIINAKNAHEALFLGLRLLSKFGYKRESRNGPVLLMDEPVATVYENAKERVVFWPERDANPFFHLMESLWMLAGRNDVEFPAYFAKSIAQFSDDGETFHGAYGHRWRNHFPKFDHRGAFLNEYIDQIPIIINRLKNNPDDRRCVLQMWDTECDLDATNVDVPCNTNIYFSISSHGRLDMTVCNRSNDIIWGAYGANVVHMSILQEYIASSIGVSVGTYTQFSNNWHAYLDILEKQNAFYHQDGFNDPYESQPERKPVFASNLMTVEKERWDEELSEFLETGGALMGMRDPFFRKIAGPMIEAWKCWKNTEVSKNVRVNDALYQLSQMPEGSDWRLACEEWLKRRVV